MDDEETKIRAALVHIDEWGDLQQLAADRSQKVALITTAGRQGLIAWARSSDRYELTDAGRRRLAGFRPSRGTRLGARPASKIAAAVVACLAIFVAGWIAAASTQRASNVSTRQTSGADAVAAKPGPAVEPVRQAEPLNDKNEQPGGGAVTKSEALATEVAAHGMALLAPAVQASTAVDLTGRVAATAPLQGAKPTDPARPNPPPPKKTAKARHKERYVTPRFRDDERATFAEVDEGPPLRRSFDRPAPLFWFPRFGDYWAR